MNCQESKRWLDAYLDGELDLPRAVELEGHLQDCPACAQAQQRLFSLREAIRAAAFQAPQSLARRVRTALLSQTRSVRPQRTPFRWWLSWGFGSAAATLCLAVILAQTVFQTGPEQRVLNEITDSHIRSLMGTHLVDVASSDQHTVRPWFEGKVDFAPPVPNLSAKGFEIIGGRLDYIAGRPTATLVYQIRKHYISLFIQPAASPRAMDIESRSYQRGYHVVSWAAHGMRYWAISEISDEELRDFAKTFRSQTP